MRIRSRGINAIQLVPDKGYVTTQGPSACNGQYGWRDVLPVSSTDSAFNTDGQIGDYESISDIPSGFGRLNDVDHTVVKFDDFKKLTFLNSTSYGKARESYDSDMCVPYVYRYATGHDPIYRAFAYMNQYSPYTDVFSDTPIPGEPTDDRLGQVPSKLLSRAQALQLAVTAYEAREFPQLVKQLNALRLLGSKRGDLFINQIIPQVRIFFQNKGTRKAFFTFLRENTLMAQFGLMPTISDAIAIAKEVSNPKPFRKFVTAAIRDVYVKDSSGKYYDPNLLATHSRSTQMKLTRVWGGNMHILKNYANYGSFGPLAQSIDMLVGHNPLASLWEVVPWSFVIDWFASIDKLIDSWFLADNADYACTYWTSWKREKTMITKAGYCTAPMPKGTIHVSEWPPFDQVFSYKQMEFVHQARRTRYVRAQVMPPSIISSVNLLGRMNLKNSFLTVLLAMGLRK